MIQTATFWVMLTILLIVLVSLALVLWEDRQRRIAELRRHAAETREDAWRTQLVASDRTRRAESRELLTGISRSIDRLNLPPNSPLAQRVQEIQRNMPLASVADDGPDLPPMSTLEDDGPPAQVECTDEQLELPVAGERTP